MSAMESTFAPGCCVNGMCFHTSPAYPCVILLNFRTRFEENRKLCDARRIQELVQAGHDQVDVALHYQIPYPRPHYVDPGTVGGDNDFRRRSSRSNTSANRTRKVSVQKQFQPRHK